MFREGFSGKLAAAANRTREIRPSGMRRGLDGDVGHGETRNPPRDNTERARSGNPCLKLRALSFYPTLSTLSNAKRRAGNGRVASDGNR